MLKPKQLLPLLLGWLSLCGCYISSVPAWAETPDLFADLQTNSFEEAESLIRDVSQRSPINVVAISSDSKLLAAGHTDNSIRLWEVYTGKEIRWLRGHEVPVVSLTFDATGKRLISSAGDNTVRVWDVKTGQQIDEFSDNSTAEDDPVKSLTITPDNKMLVLATYEGQVLIRDMETREVVSRFHNKDIDVYITSTIDISQGGRYLAYGLENGKTCLLQLSNMQLFRCFSEDEEQAILAVRFNPKGDLLATTTENGKIRLWSVFGQHDYVFQGHNKIINALAFSPEGNLLATGDEDGTILFWDVANRTVIKHINAHKGLIKTMSFNADGTMLASGSIDTSIGLWDVNVGQQIRSLGARPNQVLSVTFSANGHALATGSLDGSVRLWDSKTGKELKTLRKHTEPVFAVAFSPDGKLLASGSSDSSIYIWDVASGVAIRRLEGHEDPVFTVAFTPDGKLLASGSSDSTIRFWQVADGEQLFHLDDKGNNQVLAVAFSPDGKTMASGSWDGMVRLWNIETGTLIKALKGHRTFVRSVAYSPDGKTLASGSRDNTVILWDVTSGGTLKKLEQHTDPVFTVAFNPQGGTLASGSRDNAVILWQVETGAEIDRYQGHSEPVTAVTFSPDGTTLASGSRDNTVRLWDVDTGKLQRVLLGDVSGRWLSCEDKECLCFDNDSVWSKTKGHCDKRLTPPELQRTGSLSVEAYETSLQVPDGKKTDFTVTVKNISEERVYWTQVTHVADSINRLVLHAPDALAVLEAGQKHQFNLSVSVKSNYFDPQVRQENLKLHINSAHSQAIELNIKVKTQLPILSINKAVITSQGTDILGITLINKGLQALSQSIFRTSWQHVDTLETGIIDSISRPELQKDQAELLSFTLAKNQNLSKYHRVSMDIRKVGYPSHVWRIPVTDIKNQRLPPYFYGMLGLLLMIVIAIYYYRLYRHPLVILMAQDANNLLKVPIQQLFEVRKVLSKTNRLNTALTESQIHHRTLDDAIDFLHQPRLQQAQVFGQRLGSQTREPIQTIAVDGDVFTLYLNENFPLNLESCVLFFPKPDMLSKDVIIQLRQWDNVTLQKVVIISFNHQQQEDLRAYGLDPTTLFVVPDSVELTQWLLLSNPISAFAKVLSAQLKITQISPYQTRSGVNKDNVFFGRAQILAHMLNREPSNYLVVGGRQLGKSSVLKHLQRRYQDHADVECHYITLHGGEIHSQLAVALGLDSNSSLKNVLDYLGNPSHKKRFLLLIDEADMFVKQEKDSDYAILNQFRSLSEEGRCYFMLAGFWNLYQASVLEYQSPLKNFGEPIIIGGLEKDACLDLITKPMDMLHIQYSSEFPFNTLLTATGRRANLIAITCNEMLINLGNERRQLENADLIKALSSDAIVDALSGWESLTNDEDASRLDRIIVYATVKSHQFSMSHVRQLLEKDQNCHYTAEDIKHSLDRLTLSFVIKRANKSHYRYCVPVFRKIILDDDVDELLEWELRG